MIKVLLPTDFSKASLNAIDYALKFAPDVMGKLAAVLPLNIQRENKKCTKNCKSKIPSSCY
jgi:hypothetical protein